MKKKKIPELTYFDILEADIPAGGVDEANLHTRCSNIDAQNVGGQFDTRLKQYKYC